MPKGKKFKPKTKEETEIYTKFLNSKKIKNCINRCTHRMKTNYYPHWRDFFILIKENPDNYLINTDEIIDRKELIKYKNKIQNDLLNYVNHLNTLDKKPSPSTYNIWKASMKKLLKSYKITLDDPFLEDLSRLIPKNETVTSYIISTKKEYETIFSYLDNQGKALFLTQLSSGSRIEEILSIRLDDLDLRRKYPRFRVRYDDSKNGKQAKKRCSPEAKHYITLYKKERDAWLTSKNERMKKKNEHHA